MERLELANKLLSLFGSSGNNQADVNLGIQVNGCSELFITPILEMPDLGIGVLINYLDLLGCSAFSVAFVSKADKNRIKCDPMATVFSCSSPECFIEHTIFMVVNEVTIVNGNVATDEYHYSAILENDGIGVAEEDFKILMLLDEYSQLANDSMRFAIPSDVDVSETEEMFPTFLDLKNDLIKNGVAQNV